MGGSRYERQLVNALRACGYAAMKAPASGSATDDDLPDVLAGRAVEVTRHSPNGNPFIDTAPRALAIELKTTSATTAYADAAEIDALAAFARAFGATPYLAAKFKRSGGTRSPFYLVAPDDCRLTDAGNYGVPESDAAERAAWTVYPATANEPAEVVEA